MFSPQSVRRIIQAALQPITATKLPLYYPDTEEILMMIGAHESGLGKDLRQIGGPALGLFGVEPDTMQDNYDNFLSHRTELRRQIAEVTGCDGPDVDQLQFNPLYGAIHARLKLYRSKGRLPAKDDLQGMAEYAKEHFNSALGSATPEKYLADYRRLVLESH